MMGDDMMASLTPGMSSSHEVLDGTLSTATEPCTLFEDLPDEMVEAVFQFLDTKDLLGTCRFVSKRWKQSASELCRKRFVKLKNWWDKGVRNVDDISQLFDMENVPWSSYSLLTSYNKKQEEEDRFLNVFGKHIWHLHLNQDLCISCNEIKRVLSHTPNLRHLEIETDPDEQDWTTTSAASTSGSGGGSGGINLHKLKRMELPIVNDFTVELLNFIIADCGARLDYFKSRIEVKTAESGEMVASLLRNVPFISLGFSSNSQPYDFKTLSLAMRKLRITELSLSLGENDEDNNETETVEQFITFHAQHLERLSITVYSSVPLKFPSLPLLRSFLVEFRCELTSGFLSLLETNQFPVLTEVCIKDLKWPLSANRRVFPENCHFDSVSKLIVNCLGCLDNWNQIFPNLNFMQSTVFLRPDSDELVRHLSYKSLEHLYLQICNIASFPLDLNSMLSGIPNPDAIYQKSEEEIREERQTHGHPSILQLTKLKTLEIKIVPTRNGSTDWMLRDSGAHLALLPLQPLDLTLKHVQLSEECKAKLKAHHRTFTISD